MQAIGHKGGTLVEGHPTDLESYSPLSGGAEAWEFTTALIYDKLVDINPDDGNLYPDLASAVPTQANGGISADGLTYTFKLRPGVLWADGSKFTAADVAYEYTLLRNADVGSPFTSSVVARISSVTAASDNVVVFKLRQPVASFMFSNMYGIASMKVLSHFPAKSLETSAFAKGDPAYTFGTGPFKFSSIKGGSAVVLSQNSRYFCGVPALQNYVFQSTSNFTSSLQLLESGQLDVAQISSSDVKAAKSAGLQTFNYNTLFSTNLLFNLSSGRATSDTLLRQALMDALDIPAIAKGAGGGISPTDAGTVVTPSLIAPKSFAFGADPSLGGQQNLPAAVKLLQQAGYTKSGNQLVKDGKPVRLELWTIQGNPTRERAAAIIQQQWKLLGVQVDINTEDASAFEARYQTSKNYDVAIIGLLHSLDPDDLSQYYSGSGALNYSHYDNPSVDALLAQGVSTPDVPARNAIYGKAEQQIIADQPMPTLWFNGNVRAVSARVHNVVPNGIALDVNRWNGAWWWIS
ncbi:MAG: peptide ABC transporter substrate-binding protein [Actinomycetota bacterium]|nr:peptide ABC transporter substrate-binding protein [Actinomycetota bacterium]